MWLSLLGVCFLSVDVDGLEGCVLDLGLAYAAAMLIWRWRPPVRLGLGHSAALHDRPSTVNQSHEESRWLYF
jgi:hypothetical protein